ncbi:MAG: DMT family transporter, partial [Alphaproteobacteria bacterium]|nr:DMT family transporter [Alphaproteobacteria bacterium]
MALVSVGHAAIFIRIADADPIVVAAFRLGIATLALAPVTLIFAYSDLRALTRRELRLIAGAAVFLALHFATWIASLDFTSIANSAVLVTLNPVWLALYGLIILRVQPGRRTWLSIALAVLGSMIIALGSAAGGSTSLLGDLLALAGGFFIAGFLLIAHRVRQTVALLPFVTLVYGAAAVLLWIVVIALGLPVAGLTGTTYGAVIALALISQVIGHTGINWAVRAIPATLLAIVILGEPVLTAMLGWAYFGEGVG